MKGSIITGIALIVVGMAAAFGKQIYVAFTLGLPTTPIAWLQTTGFVVAVIGAIVIGAAIGRKRKAAKAAARR